MKKSYLILHVAVLLAGFTGVFGKLISLNEIPLVWFRVFLSSIILFLGLKLYGVSSPKSYKDRLEIAKTGILITAHWVFFYASIKYSNISIGVVCYCLTSFFTAIFDPLLNRSKFSKLQLGLSALTLAGISLIFHFDSSFQLGIMLGVVSSALAALFTIYNERLVRKYDSKVINYYQMAGGTTVLGLMLPLFFYLNPTEKFLPNLSDFGMLLLLAFFCTVVLYVLVAESLRTMSAFTVNLSFNMEPIYAIAIAFVFFNEGQEVGYSFYMGLFLVVSSVIFQTLISSKKEH